MPYLLKPSRSPGRGLHHGCFIATTDDVAKREIEQFLANGSGAEPWPMQRQWLVASLLREYILQLKTQHIT